jgi:hypothetical protein
MPLVTYFTRTQTHHTLVSVPRSNKTRMTTHLKRVKQKYYKDQTNGLSELQALIGTVEKDHADKEEQEGKIYAQERERMETIEEPDVQTTNTHQTGTNTLVIGKRGTTCNMRLHRKRSTHHP